MMRPKATNFFQLKLENLFKAHQDAFKKHSLTESSLKKANLEEDMLLYENRILKMLSKRTETNEPSTLKSSFYLTSRSKFSKNIKHHKLTILAIKNGLSTNFFLRKRQKSVCENKLEELIKNNNLDFGKLNECFDEKLFKEKSVCEEMCNDISNKNSTASSLIGDEDDDQSNSASSNIDDQPITDDSVPFSSTSTDDQASKIEFLRKLGLVTAEEYKEIVNRKNSRKRRTTANPNFSNAAIEAKRQTKLVIIEERKYRQKLAVERQSQLNKINDENLIPSAKTCNFSFDKSRNLFKIENKQLFPGTGLYLVKKMSSVKYYCKVCLDQCQCNNDSVIVCKMCSSFYHATCLLSKKDLVKLLVLNCPNCTDDSIQSSTITRTEQNNLIKRLNGLQDYIGSLTNATIALQLLYEKKESEKVKLLNDFNSLQSNVGQILTNLNYGHLISSIKLPRASCEQTVHDGNSVDNQKVNEVKKLAQTYLDGGTSMLADSIGRLEANLYSHPNKSSYLDGPTATCKSDINVMTLCI